MNKVDHRLFSYISMNWHGRPLISHQVIVSPIVASWTGSGRIVDVRLDETEYAKGIKVSDKQLEAVNLRGHAFHLEWNCTISRSPRPAAVREDSPRSRSPRHTTRASLHARRALDRASPPAAQAAPDC